MNSQRVIRGGGVINVDVRVAYRVGSAPLARDAGLGFRPVRTIKPGASPKKNSGTSTAIQNKEPTSIPSLNDRVSSHRISRPSEVSSTIDDPSSWPDHPLKEFLMGYFSEVGLISYSQMWGRREDGIRGALSPKKWYREEPEDIRPWRTAYLIPTKTREGKRRLYVELEFLQSQEQLPKLPEGLYAIALILPPQDESLLSSFITWLPKEPEINMDCLEEDCEDYIWKVDDLQVTYRKTRKGVRISIARADVMDAIEDRDNKTKALRTAYLDAKNLLFGDSPDLEASIAKGEEALDTMQHLKPTFFHGDTVVNLCQAYYRLGKVDKARELCRQAFIRSIEPSVHAEARLYLAKMLMWEGKKEEAVNKLQEADKELKGPHWLKRRIRMFLGALTNNTDPTLFRRLLAYIGCERGKRLGVSWEHAHEELGYQSLENLVADAGERFNLDADSILSASEMRCSRSEEPRYRRSIASETPLKSQNNQHLCPYDDIRECIDFGIRKIWGENTEQEPKAGRAIFRESIERVDEQCKSGDRSSCETREELLALLKPDKLMDVVSEEIGVGLLFSNRLLAEDQQRILKYSEWACNGGHVHACVLAFGIAGGGLDDLLGIESDKSPTSSKVLNLVKRACKGKSGSGCFILARIIDPGPPVDVSNAKMRRTMKKMGFPSNMADDVASSFSKQKSLYSQRRQDADQRYRGIRDVVKASREADLRVLA